ncbi:MAG: MarR family winged helix-turn-helix transcriptional regulator [Nitrospira sp.]|nr:MarR family winged helix-turn-helix transcriptional regulator [Nitrospira sp.]
MGKRLPMHGEKTIVDHITAGLTKVAAALRSQAWEGGTARKLTPTQGQILVLLEERDGQSVRLNDVASALCLSAATASDAVITLVEKQLVKKERLAEDQRALVLTLTAAGRREVRETRGWTEVVDAGVKSLTPDEQAIFLRGLTKVIHSLQGQGVISVARMCAGCAYFQPYVHADAARPHHCGLVNKPMGEGQLRIDCPDFVPGREADQLRRWQAFVSGGEGR